VNLGVQDALFCKPHPLNINKNLRLCPAKLLITKQKHAGSHVGLVLGRDFHYALADGGFVCLWLNVVYKDLLPSVIFANRTFISTSVPMQFKAFFMIYRSFIHYFHRSA
jgi:hypothetical protein